MLIIGSKV